jgi:hypothetical protein
MNQLSNFIAGEEWKDPHLLADLQPNHALIVASDYSGSHPKSRYEVFSFLFASMDDFMRWNVLRQELREDFGMGKRRFGFKSLNDVKRRVALVSFLSIAHNLTGSLVTLALRRPVIDYWEKDPPSELATQELGLNTWSRSTLDRLIAIGHLSGFLFSCLTHPNQSLLWVSDQDEIFANEQLHINATNVLSWIHNHYLRHPLSKVSVATTKSDSGQLELEDICSLPDLSAGALADFLNVHGTTALTTNIVLPLRLDTRIKSNVILQWLSAREGNLRKLMLIWDRSVDGKKRFIRIQLEPDRSLLVR